MSVETARRPWENAVTLVAVATGAVAGGGVFWTIGYYAWVEPVAGGGGSLLGLLSLVALMFGLVAPMTVVVYFGRNLEGIKRTLTIAAGYVIMLSFVAVLAYLGILARLGITTAVEAIAFIDTVTGICFGGIFGDKISSKLLEE